MTELVAAGPVELSWDSGQRIARLSFVEEGEGGRAEAEELSGHLASWVGDRPDPYVLYVDCSSIVDVDPGWRAVWAEFFKQHRDTVRIAWFNANARIRLIIFMFVKGTGITGAAFSTEEEARAWIEEGEA